MNPNLFLFAHRILIMKVFLGGTCNESVWRNELIPMLKIDYFNPVVDDWTPDCVDEEYRQKASSDYELYVFTPELTGCFSVAELIHAAHTKKVACAIIGDWSQKPREYKSLNECLNLAVALGAKRFESLIDVAEFLNSI